ncbi:hypothetical protein CBR_g38770 [Chara braunii]|uniref:RBR-type E3 ubiquitin transferase n=1 Tax=Chara braunii TaxID=69332 RepID=A0A388LQ79_CHABU|nr:hypothetical protein CBR_g38770 [Chara braunii]|eukprot:GBG84486.1 hypothetical protein CBR_g38770 [Chara braunii]
MVSEGEHTLRVGCIQGNWSLILRALEDIAVPWLTAGKQFTHGPPVTWNTTYIDDGRQNPLHYLAGGETTTPMASTTASALGELKLAASETDIRRADVFEIVFGYTCVQRPSAPNDERGKSVETTEQEQQQPHLTPRFFPSSSQLALVAGASLTVKNQEGETPFLVAIRTKSLAVIGALIDIWDRLSCYKCNHACRESSYGGLPRGSSSEENQFDYSYLVMADRHGETPLTRANRLAQEGTANALTERGVTPLSKPSAHSPDVLEMNRLWRARNHGLLYEEPVFLLIDSRLSKLLGAAMESVTSCPSAGEGDGPPADAFSVPPSPVVSRENSPKGAGVFHRRSRPPLLSSDQQQQQESKRDRRRRLREVFCSAGKLVHQPGPAVLDERAESNLDAKIFSAFGNGFGPAPDEGVFVQLRDLEEIKALRDSLVARVVVNTELDERAAGLLLDMYHGEEAALLREWAADKQKVLEKGGVRRQSAGGSKHGGGGGGGGGGDGAGGKMDAEAEVPLRSAGDGDDAGGEMEAEAEPPLRSAGGASAFSDDEVGGRAGREKQGQSGGGGGDDAGGEMDAEAGGGATTAMVASESADGASTGGGGSIFLNNEVGGRAGREKQGDNGGGGGEKTLEGGGGGQGGKQAGAGETAGGEETATCIVCFDDLVVDCPCPCCGQTICATCLRKYAASRINDGEVRAISCPGGGCARLLAESEVRELVDGGTFKRYQDQLANKFVAASNNVRWCPLPGCGRAVYHKRESSEENVSSTLGEGGVSGINLARNVECICGHAFCWNCRKPAHEPATCKQVDKWDKQKSVRLKNAEALESADWIRKHAKYCPSCRTICQRDGGCNHMTCPQCGHEFCW